MLLSDFDYELPQRLIAQHPSHEREASRLLHVHAQGREHLMFSQLQQLLRPGDLLVLNNTKVVKGAFAWHQRFGWCRRGLVGAGSCR